MSQKAVFKKPVILRASPITQAVRVLIVLAGMAAPGLALAQLGFSTSPPMNSSAGGVRPNIILAIDNSGSMAMDDATGSNGRSDTRMNALRAALVQTFGALPSDQNSVVNKIRLAYEAMWTDAGFGPKRLFPTTTACGDNSMRLFDTTYQSCFLTWVNKLAPNGSTPSQWMIGFAGEYLRGRWLNSPTWGINNGTMVSMPAANSPWNQTPGTADPSPLSCRRAYFIFMTDGLWNYPDYNMYPPGIPAMTGDNTATQVYTDVKRTLPEPITDGINTYTTYDPASWPLYPDILAPAPYGGNPNSKNSSSLASFAFYYWANDLQPTISNKIDTSQVMPVTTPQTYTYAGKSVTYPPAWNPQNDPATWQHMQTYTIGFGTSAYGGAGDVLGANPDLYNGSFITQYASGVKRWPQTGIDVDPANLYDLVHAAFNGRGKFYQATSQMALTQAFQDILHDAVTQSAPGGIASASGSSSQLTQNTMQYVAQYSYGRSSAAGSTYDLTNNWWGVTGTINGWSGQVQGLAGNDSAGKTPLWGETGAKIPAEAKRQIFTADATGKGIPFQWAGLSADTTLTAAGLTKADVNAVRNNPLGDIINSQLFFTGNFPPSHLDPTATNKQRTNVVYVGANDGMLHGFDAGQGTSAIPGSGGELMAYVPRGLLIRPSGNTSTSPLHLNTFASASYMHHYWVDGSPFSGDFQTNDCTGTTLVCHWATALVGTLGAGGPGYFVLNVSDPSLFASESNASRLVLLDATNPASSGNKTVQAAAGYIGSQFSQPTLSTNTQSAQIVRINTTGATPDWAVIMGNGYNSANGSPVLLIQSLTETGMPLYMVVATPATPATCGATASSTAPDYCTGNGLSGPRVVDVDGNGTADIVYAGDLQGNLWKFDISSTDSTQWKVAYGGKPMFTAVGPTGQPQPITSAPVVMPNPSGEGGFLVAFGTGRNLTDADMADTNLNSVYGLYDAQKLSVTEPDPASASQNSMMVLTDPPPNTFCSSSTGGATRYDCLYQQTGGSMRLGTAQKDGNGLMVTSNASTGDTPGVGQPPAGGGSAKLGWYYDIPETDNGNAAKVLGNPFVIPGNTLEFYSVNVASTTGTGAVSSATESCNGSVASGAITTVNFLDILSGNYTENTISVGTLKFPPGKGNRFRIDGVTTYLRNGDDAVNAVGADGQIKAEAQLPPGKRVGWRILQ